MKRRVNSGQSHHKSEPASPPGKQTVNAVVAAVLAGVLCLIFFMLARSNAALQEAILLERIDYVEEISAQIMTSQLFMEQEYSATAVNLANILERESFASLEEVHEYIISKSASEILLVSAGNSIVDLSGKHISMPNNVLIQRMMNNSGVTELFSSLNYEEDSWLFAAHFTPRTIDGVVYKAVILAVSADEFRDNMAISLFDDRGASYIVNNDGRIKIKPHNENLAFNGFNLFSSMISQGALEEDIAQLERELWNQQPGSNLLTVGELDWLVGHTPLDHETSIIVAIPLTLTAARTYDGLSATIILAALSVIVVAVIALLFIWQFFRRDQWREQQAMAVAAKSEFFSKMSHDIRTPLNAVIGLVTLAKDSTNDPTVKGYLTQSSAAAKYLLSIINDVLDMSRIESGNIAITAAPFDMIELLEEVKHVVRPLAAEKELSFAVEINDAFDTAYIGDQVRIKQILTNLLSNATKFTKQGGRIELKVARAAGPEGYDRVTLVVADSGIGMSEQYLRHIFKPFEQEQSSYTQQYAGSGLGLSIVHSLVEMMDGTIDVTSQLDEGSTFTVTLPLRRGEKIVRAARPPQREATTFPGKRVLLAEDNELNQMVAATLLAATFKIETDTAADGQIALQMFADSAPGTYDLILMDVKMPNMDGLDATRAIRALPRPDAGEIPIIALSANAYKEDRELSLAAGMNDHLPKPLDIEAMTLAFQRYWC